jgi:hypothetical protein
MKPTEAAAAQPQPQPAQESTTQPAPARAVTHDASPFATHDVLFTFAFRRPAKEDQ